TPPSRTWPTWSASHRSSGLGPRLAAGLATLDAEHIRTGLHRARGETTKPIERSHVVTRDRLRASRGLKTLATGQRFFEGFEALRALRRGHIHPANLVPGHDPAHTTVPQHVRAVAEAMTVLGARLRKGVARAS